MHGTAGQAQRVVTFLVSDHPCAIPIQDVREVLPMARLARPPGTPALIDGFLHLEGRAIPVVSLARLFGLPEAPDGGLFAHLLLLRAPDSPLALLVERVLDVLSIGEAELAPLPGGHCLNSCADAAIRRGEQTIHRLVTGRILMEQERRAIADLHAREQERLLRIREERA